MMATKTQLFGPLLAFGMCLGGCHHYPYASPYGNYGGYGPVYGPTYGPTPGGMMAPGPTYVPTVPGGPSGPIPAPSNPGSPTPLPGNPNQPTWRPDPADPAGDAPPFQGNDRSVPPGQDPGFDPLGTSIDRPGALPVAVNEPLPMSPVADNAAPAEADPFEAPITTVGATAKPAPNPYGYDGENYTWLRGVVAFDADDNTWSIIYSLTPPASERFGGSCVFAPHPELSNLVDGDVVLVKGLYDPGMVDSSGKPKYVIRTLSRLEPVGR
jgi:hypothetical protein